MEVLIDYGYDVMNRVKFKPRHRQPFSRLQHTSKALRFHEACNQGQRVLASMLKLGMRPKLSDIIGPIVREVRTERSSRTGSMVLEARYPTVIDRSRTSEDVAIARRALRQSVLEN